MEEGASAAVPPPEFDDVNNATESLLPPPPPPPPNVPPPTVVVAAPAAAGEQLLLPPDLPPPDVPEDDETDDSDDGNVNLGQVDAVSSLVLLIQNKHIFWQQILLCSYISIQNKTCTYGSESSVAICCLLQDVTVQWFKGLSPDTYKGYLNASK